LWYPAPTERARISLAQGRIDEAVRWTEERGLTEDDEVSYPRERDYLLLARVFLVRSQPDRALGLLERLDALAASQRRNGSLVEIRALRALALQTAGNHARALATLNEALSLGRAEGYIRVFADEGASMAALVRGFVSASQRGRIEPVSGAARDHLNRVIRAFAAATGPEKSSAGLGGLVEPLTNRELEVLSLIAAGKRNREIADELVVTLETVKKHVSHIFDKLGATNRTEAVKQARELGVISSG
jgi:LuxR family maltose regulon positive regulatory protein